MSEKSIKKALNELVKKDYLKKTKEGYKDSDRTTALEKEGKTRKEIAEMLDKGVKDVKKRVRTKKRSY